MGKLKKMLLMEEHVCPAFIYFSLGFRMRKLAHDPAKLFGEYVREGQTALDLGCGPGFFTMGLAGLVGGNGKVLAVDIQKKAIDIVSKKAGRMGLESVVVPVLAAAGDISVKDKADFTLSFWMLHEVPDKASFIRQVRNVMKPGSHFFLVEPKLHVSKKRFMEEIGIIRSGGMELVATPKVALSRAALFRV